MQPGLPDNMVTEYQRQQREKEGRREREREGKREAKYVLPFYNWTPEVKQHLFYYILSKNLQKSFQVQKEKTKSPYPAGGMLTAHHKKNMWNKM